MSVMRRVAWAIFILFGIYLAAWAGAPVYVIKPVQKIYQSTPGIPLVTDPSELNPPAVENEQ